MKKVFALLLAIVILTSLAACGIKNKKESVLGTWIVDCIEKDGSKFSVDEWKTLEDEDLSTTFFVFKDGGKVYICYGDDGDLVDWLQSENIIMIDGKKGELVDGKIVFDYYSNKLYLSKKSDSQEIPKTVEEATTVEETTTESKKSTSSASNEINSVSSSNTEWRKFLNDYEAWADSYIAILKKYKADPTDMTILADYSKMVDEMSKWTDRADAIQDELADSSEALEYSAEIMRITAKISKETEEM